MYPPKVGPMAGAKHVQKVRSYLESAPGDDVQVVGTDRAPVPTDGFYVSPAVLAGVGQESRRREPHRIEPQPHSRELHRINGRRIFRFMSSLPVRPESTTGKIVRALLLRAVGAVVSFIPCGVCAGTSDTS